MNYTCQKGITTYVWQYSSRQKRMQNQKKNKYEVDCFFNNSYVFDLCKDYIELYRNKEVKLYKLKKEYLRG